MPAQQSEFLGWTCPLCGRQNTHPLPPDKKRGDSLQLTCRGCSRGKAVLIGWNVFPDRRRKPRAMAD